MASIKRRPNYSGPKPWRARYDDADGREHSKHFARKVDGEAWLVAEQAKVATGTWVDPKAGKTLFGPYARDWQSNQVFRPSTAMGVDSMLNRHILPVFEERPFASIKKSSAQGFVRSLAEKPGRGGSTMKPATVAKTYKLFARIMRAACEDGLIAKSPCEKIALPRDTGEEIVPLETAVVHGIAEHMPERLRAMVYLIAGCGHRLGEASGQPVDRVDFLRRKVRIGQQLLATVPPTVGPLKTTASNRTVPLSTFIGERLAAHLVEFPAPADGAGKGLLFTDENGEPWKRRDLSRAFLAAITAAAAPAGTSPHDLRHYFASLLIERGASVKVVQALLGHEKASTTLDTYGHLWPNSEDQTRAAVDAVLAAPADQARTKARSTS